MLDYVHGFLWALFSSVVIESLVAVILCAILKKDKLIFLIAALGTLCTIPYVWFVFPTLLWYASGAIVYFGEGFAFLFEAILYRMLGKLNWKYALLFSFLANVASFSVGLVLL